MIKYECYLNTSSIGQLTEELGIDYKYIYLEIYKI